MKINVKRFILIFESTKSECDKLIYILSNKYTTPRDYNIYYDHGA